MKCALITSRVRFLGLHLCECLLNEDRHCVEMQFFDSSITTASTIWTPGLYVHHLRFVHVLPTDGEQFHWLGAQGRRLLADPQQRLALEPTGMTLCVVD